jgi:hypothetical protein
LIFGLSALFGSLLIAGAFMAWNGWSELQLFKIGKPDLYADLIHAEGFYPKGQEDFEEATKVWAAAMEHTLWPIWYKIDHGLALLIGTVSTILYWAACRVVCRRDGIPIPSRVGLGILTAVAVLLSIALSVVDTILNVFWREIVPGWSDSVGIVLFTAIFTTPFLAGAIVIVSLLLSFLGSRPGPISTKSDLRVTLGRQIVAFIAASPFWAMAALSILGSEFPVAAATPLWLHIGLTLWAYVRNGRPPKLTTELAFELHAPAIVTRETVSPSKN